jgi:hypothetical protein
MNISALKSQNLADYINLLANPTFLNAVKSAATKNSAESSKYDSLLENLEKLSTLLSSSQNTGESPSLLTATGSAASGNSGMTASQEAQGEMKQNMMEVAALGQVVDQLIANADMLEALLDLEVLPSDDQLIDLFQKFREIIAKLDGETRKLQQEVKDKEIKAEYKLRPSSETDVGVQAGLTLLAK